jgi:hypothetical protein
VVGALSAFYPDSVNIHDAAQRRLSAIRLIAKMPTIAAIAYKTSIGQPIVYPSNSLSFAANFLHMMFATPAEPYTVNPVHAAALETILILHADHEQNASTSTVRIASSSQARPSSAAADPPPLLDLPLPSSMAAAASLLFPRPAVSSFGCSLLHLSPHSPHPPSLSTPTRPT